MSTTMIAPLALCLRDGTVLNAVTYNRGDLLYGIRQDPHEPFGPMFADIPADAGLVGLMERDPAYYSQPESGYEYHFTQEGRRYKFVGRDDVSVVGVYVQDEPEPPEPGTVDIGGDFKGSLRWVPPGHRHPTPPPITQRDWLRGEDVVDEKATQARDARLYDRRLEAERAEAQASKKVLEADWQRVERADTSLLPALIAELTAKAHFDARYTKLVEIAEGILQDKIGSVELTPEEVRARQEVSGAADARLGAVLRPVAEASAAATAQPAPSEPVPDSEAEKYADDQAGKEDVDA